VTAVRPFWRNLITALLILRRNRLRSALTGLGLTIGVAAVVALMEIGRGTAHAVQETMASLGANFLIVEAGAFSSSGVSLGPGTVVTLTAEDCEAILRECPAVRWAAPGVDCRMQVVHGNRNCQPWKVLGTSPDFLLVRDWADLQEGEPFSDADVACAACVCLMGQTPARELFGDESPVGKQVRVNGVLLKVIGVLRPKGASMKGLDQDDLVLAPWTTVKFRILGARLKLSERPAASPFSQVNTLNQVYPGAQQSQLYPQPSPLQAADTPRLVRFSDLDNIQVSATSPEDVPLAIEQITRLLRERHRLRDDQPSDFGIHNMTEVSNSLGSATRALTDLLLWVALISLLVGGVGIMNIMLVSVTERTREIGLRMAVGARARDVRRQFLTEAILLCLLGGSAGTLLGRAASFAIGALWKWPIAPSLSAVLAALGISVAVGVIFGCYPAWRASRLDPIEALRHE
jgi:ABC-type antimicrobial peptide transport system permease subunit